jgi:carbonic anhydrase
MIERAQQSLVQLLEGNERFLSKQNHHRVYEQDHLASLAVSQSPIAAIVACVDSRVAPELIFDQPLGALFVSRVPANVASDSAKWMIDIATGEFNVPLIMVLGHIGCVAVRQAMEDRSGPGGSLRFIVQSAATRARLKNPDNVYEATVRENAVLTLENLRDESESFRDGLRLGKTSAVAAVYHMDSGQVEMIGELTP